MTRTTAWLRIILWITPGLIALLIFLMGSKVVVKSGLSIDNGNGLLLFAFTFALLAASYCDALLWRKQSNDFEKSLIWQGSFFCLCQIFITPLVAGILGFACCVFQLG